MSDTNATENLVVANADAERRDITHVEGVELGSPATIRVLSEGPAMLLVEVTMPPDGYSRPHTHEHESVGYLVSGRAQTVIEGVEYELAPGDGFRHPTGALHSMKALDQGAVWLEIKSPPERTW